jgi:L-malate glycosyltransferase
VNYKFSLAKKNIELIFMFPFVLAGKIAGVIFPLKTSHTIFIFCPSADIGGSVQINADIAECVKDKLPLVVFSKTPKNNQFIHLFKRENIRTIDLHKYVDNKAYHFVNFFYRGVISQWINKVDHPVVLGGESLFFYKVLPHIKKQARRIDLCHLNTWFNYSQAFIKYLDARIFSTPKIKREVAELYSKHSIPGKYFTRLYFIDNKIKIPAESKKANKILSVLFVGRGAPQKRVHIIAEIAKRFIENKHIHFSFVGDVEKVIDPLLYPYCTFHGNVKDENAMKEIYATSDILLLTSSNEGLPLTVMEMMAHGKVIVSTAVGGIPDYIINGENGFLIQNYTNENDIIEQAVKVFDNLLQNPALLETVSKTNRIYAEEHFGGETFCNKYRKILFGELS